MESLSRAGNINDIASGDNHISEVCHVARRASVRSGRVSCVLFIAHNACLTAPYTFGGKTCRPYPSMFTTKFYFVRQDNACPYESYVLDPA